MNKIICINPGHGGSDPGVSVNGVPEKDINLAISLYQAKRFTELGWQVVLTRDKDQDAPLSEAAKIVINSGAGICLSNHNNSAENSNANGFEAIHSMHSDGKLANMILNNVVLIGLVKGRRVFSRESDKYPGKDYYYMHRETGKVQTIIIEYGFLTNDNDRKILTNPVNQSSLGEAVVKAVCEYAGTEYAPPKAATEDPEAWKKKDIDELAGAGLINNPDYWKERVNNNMPVWAVMALVNRLRKSK